MTELPGTPWRAERWDTAEALVHAPMPAEWRPAGDVRHGFTHFELHIALFTAQVAHIDAEGFLQDVADIGHAGLPSVMMKCADAVRPRAAGAPGRTPGRR
jgi:A/G-specific adenine glycosylase